MFVNKFRGNGELKKKKYSLGPKNPNWLETEVNYIVQKIWNCKKIFGSNFENIYILVIFTN